MVADALVRVEGIEEKEEDAGQGLFLGYLKRFGFGCGVFLWFAFGAMVGFMARFSGISSFVMTI